MAMLISTEKGKRCIVHDGFSFYEAYDRKDKTETVWMCTDYWKISKCPAKLITNNFTSQENLQVIEYIENSHERHTGNPVSTANRVIDHRVRTIASTTTETTRNVVQQSADHLSTQDALIVLPTRNKQNTSRNIQGQRKRRRESNGQEPEIPTTAAFEIPEEIRNMPNGENFILDDWTSDDNVDRILLMGSNGQLSAFESCTHIAMDGTFKKVPAAFYQLYTIHGLIDGSFKPLLFALLTKKDQMTYERLLRMIFGIAPRLNLQTISVDFERAMINAACSVFPDSAIQCCYFHFGQSVYRRIQSLGLARDYSNNLNFNRFCKMLVGLAFLPLDRVREGFRTISRAAENEDNFPAAASQLLDYIARNYVGTNTHGGAENPPMFLREWWNVSSRVAFDLPRTTNSLEAWHSALGKSIKIDHPNIWALIKQLKSETVSTLLAIAHTQVFTPSQSMAQSQRKKYYMDINKVMQEALNQLDLGELAIMPFLRTAAHRIELAV